MENEKKPKKRSLRLLSVLTVVLLLAFMAVPAFAAGNEDHTVSGVWRFNDVLIGQLPPTDSTYPYAAVYVNFQTDYLGTAVDCIGFMFEEHQPDVARMDYLLTDEFASMMGSDNATVYIHSAWNGVFGEGVKTIDFGSTPQPVSAEFYAWLLRNAVPANSFRDSVTSGLTVVIEWVGTVVSSLFSGELSGLLPIVAIPVAVTLLVLAIYFIRRSIWGA